MKVHDGAGESCFTGWTAGLASTEAHGAFSDGVRGGGNAKLGT